MKRNPCVYILTNKNHNVVYVGVTSDLVKRLSEHKSRFYRNAFTSRYNVTELVYFEEYKRMVDAIKREKQLKAGSRAKKINLILTTNPKWEEITIY